MTDEIRITRRFAFPDNKSRPEQKYEFYEIEWKSTKTGLGDFEMYIEAIEKRVRILRKELEIPVIGEPTPESSPTSSDDQYSDLLLYDNEKNTVRLSKYIKDKEKWAEINTYLKGLGYNWFGAGKDSRWER